VQLIDGLPEFITLTQGIGLVEFNLEPFIGSNDIGIEFTLGSGDFEYGSQVRISDLKLTIPESAPLLLFLIGLLGMTSIVKQRR